MTKTLAFHNDPELRAKTIAEMKEHRRMDDFLQGYGYWKDGKGCHIGCLVKSSNHWEVESRFGIPVKIAFLFDSLFEGQSVSRAKEFPVRSLEAIRCGADLSMV